MKTRHPAFPFAPFRIGKSCLTRSSTFCALVTAATIGCGWGQTTYDWLDTAPDGNWKQGVNNGPRWNPGGLWDEPPTNGILQFNNNHQTAMTNNVGGIYSLHGIVFGLNNTATRTLGGNAIRLYDFNSGASDPFIRNNSSGSHVINLNLEGDGDGGDPLKIQLNGSGSLTFGGTINNQGSNINVEGTTESAATVSLNGVVSGSGGLYLNNSNISLILGASHTFSGQTTVDAGKLILSNGGSLANSDVRLASGAQLEVNASAQVASLAEKSTGVSGTAILASGATLTINGTNKGNLFQNSISGDGNLVMAGSGDTSLSLFGTQSYIGTTTVSGGKISSAVTMETSAVVVSGGEFEMTADDKLADTTSLSISGGTLDLQGTDTVASLTSTGGAIILGSGKTLTVTGDSSIGAGSMITGGTLKASGGTLTFDSLTGNSSAITIDSTARLAGAGTVGGATTINSGTLAPTAQLSGSKMTLDSTLEFNSGSIFSWELNAEMSDPGANASNSGTYGQLLVNGAASGTAVFNIVLGTNAYDDLFWNTDKTWDNVFAASGVTDLYSMFTTFSGEGLTATGSGATAIATATGEGHFSFNGTTLTWTAVPEPSSALAGLLIGAGLLRRRRG